MKKFIPIISMLLVVVSLLGTSTYAWFTMNTTATASGMKIKAVSSGGIAIASYGNGGSTPAASEFKSEAVAQYSAEGSVYPTSTVSGTSWWRAFASETDNYAVNASGYTKVTDGELSSYVLTSKFQVKSLASEGADPNLYVKSITLAGVDDGKMLNKALRIAVLYNNTIHIIAPLRTGADSSLTCVDESGTAITYPSGFIDHGKTFEMVGEAYTSGDGKIYLGKATREAQDLTLYIYFEGEDTECYSLNAISVDQISISVAFGIPEPTPAAT